MATPLQELEMWWHEHGRTGEAELWDIVGRVIVNEQEACAKVADESAADHDEDTPGGFCAANAARHAAKKIRERK